MNIKNLFLCAAVAVATLGAAHSQTTPNAAMASAHSDAEQIRSAMKKQFDKPEAPLSVEPVTIEGKYAIAGWTQDKRGGRAMLEKMHDGWHITLCAGDGLAKASVLRGTGMDKLQADRLAAAVAKAESGLSPAKLRAFASFEGLVKIDPAAGHGHHGEHAKP